MPRPTYQKRAALDRQKLSDREEDECIGDLDGFLGPSRVDGAHLDGRTMSRDNVKHDMSTLEIVGRVRKSSIMLRDEVLGQSNTRWSGGLTISPK